MYTLLDILTRRVADLFERALDAIVDRTYQARPELDRQGNTGGVDIGPRREARRIFVYLDHCPLAVELDYLADEVELAHLDEVEHLRLFDPAGMDHRPYYLVDLSDYLKHCPSPRRLPSRRPRRISSSLYHRGT